MNETSPLPNLNFRRKAVPNLAAFEALLDQLPAAALIAEARSGRVLLVNAHLTQLTAYTRLELQNFNLTSLFPAFDTRQLTHRREDDPQTWDLSIATNPRMKTPLLEVQVSTSLLDVEGKWVLINIEPLQALLERQAKQNRQKNLWQTLENLAKVEDGASLAETLEILLRAASAVIDFPLLAIYQAESNTPSLVRTAVFGPAELLPERLHPHDLTSLAAPHLWISTKRAQSSLHRAARAANLSFLVSAPLGQPNASIGLLVAAGEHALPDDALPRLQYLAAAVTSLIEKQTLVSSQLELLQRQKRQLALVDAVKNNILDGIIVLTPDMRIADLNAAAETILGYPSQEIAGQPYQNILVGVENLFPPFIADDPVTVHNLGHNKLYRRDGRPFLASLRSMGFMFDDQLENLIVLIQDLSEEEQVRLENQQLSQRALFGEVSAIFAHEVRNPINNISSGLQLLSYQLPPDDSKQEVISRLEHDCERLAELMKSTLSFVKPIEYKMGTVDLEVELKRLLERWHPHMVHANIQHTLQIEPGTSPIEGDVRALEQVWTNLINNALQAMGKKGGMLSIRVRPVTTADNNNRIEVSVSDTGSGIPDEIRERIFEPFFTTSRNGTGLGLSITKQIVVTHKGTISVNSVPGGTVFKIQLPLASNRHSTTVNHIGTQG